MKQIKYGFGIDMAKDKFDCCLSAIADDQQVSIRAQCSFRNTLKGFEAFQAWAKKNTPLSIPSVFLMEATGIYYEPLAWYLHSKDCAVSVVLPNKAKKYKEALGFKSKNDKIDAQALSRMCCEQAHSGWKPLSKGLYTLRIITRQIESICAQSTAATNQLKAMAYGMYRDKESEKMLAKQLALYAKQKLALKERVEQLIAGDPILAKKFKNILNIKGLGIQTLAVIVAETAGFAAFESTSQLVSYAGYDVVENQSGARTGKTRISKKGNSHIRRAMHFAAFNMVRYQVTGLCDLYNRVYERSRIKMKGYVAVQKKLLTIIYALWKKDEAFDPNYKWVALGKSKKEIEKSEDTEPVPSLATAQESSHQTTPKRITPANKTRVTEDRHPTTHRRMPSLASPKLKEKYLI